MARVAVLLTDKEERRFDAYCEALGFKKSTLIARLIREHLDREGFSLQPGLFDSPARPSKRRQNKPVRHRRSDRENEP